MISLGRLSIRSLRYRKLTLVLSVSSIALSVILLLGVERIRQQVHKSFSSTISGTDLIVGARTGNVSLLLSSVFHIGYVNQNLSYESYEHISSMPEVDWSIPLSLGEESFMEHEEEPFTVAGILKPTGTPVDQTIHVSL
jgi:putative ABC transport system permease protein